MNLQLYNFQYPGIKTNADTFGLRENRDFSFLYIFLSPEK